MRSPYTVSTYTTEELTQSWYLSREDGNPVDHDGDLPIMGITYSSEKAAIAALQKYSREFWRSIGAI